MYIKRKYHRQYVVRRRWLLFDVPKKSTHGGRRYVKYASMNVYQIFQLNIHLEWFLRSKIRNWSCQDIYDYFKLVSFWIELPIWKKVRRQAGGSKSFFPAVVKTRLSEPVLPAGATTSARKPCVHFCFFSRGEFSSNEICPARVRWLYTTCDRQMSLIKSIFFDRSVIQ